ncbi:MAG: PAS domain S-box protein, partial [Campylobacterales bacterium]|nr:PAS domain S-box protein [Campylobacterales bacterium]
MKDFEKAKLLDNYLIVTQADANGVIVYVNDKFCEVTGYTKDEVIGKTHSI